MSSILTVFIIEILYTLGLVNLLALIYFAQFYNEVEILEPKELRDKIKEKTMEMLELYK